MEPLTKEHFARAARDVRFRAFLMSEYQLTEDDLPPLTGDSGGSPTSAPEPSPDFSDVEGEASGPAKPGSILGNAVRRLGGPFAPIGAAANLADRLAPGTTDAAVSGDMAKSVFRGATLGLGDEAVNTLRAGVAARNEPFGAAFDRYQAQSDSARLAFSREHPALDMAGQMGGAFLTAPLALPRALGAVPNTASTGAKLLGMGKRIGAVGGIGAVTGAVAGAGDPGEGESRPEAARRGALVGGVIGGGTAVLGETGQAGWQLLKRVFGKSQPGEIAERYLAEAGETVTDASRRAAEQVGQGKPPTVADAMGRSGIRLGKDVAGSSPQAADRLAAMGRERTRPAVAGRELVSDVEASIGIPKRSTILTQRAIDDTRKAAAQQVYPILQKDLTPIDDPVINDILKTSLGQRAYRAALRIANADRQAARTVGRTEVPFVRLGGTKPSTLSFPSATPVTPAKPKRPNLATLDWIKRGMDEMLDTPPSTTPGVGEALSKQEIKSLREIRRAFVGRLDELGQSNPSLAKYSQIRKFQEAAFADVKALDWGFKRFRGVSAPSGSVTDDLRLLTEDAMDRGLAPARLLDHYRSAALDGFTSRIRTGSLNKAEQLQAIESLREIGVTPSQIDDLLSRVRTTQERQELGQVFQRLLGGGDDHVVGNKGAAFGDIATGNLPGAGRNLFKAAHNRFTGITPGTAPPVADLLRQPADAGLKSIRGAERELFTRRNRIGNEALVAFLLGQQAGGQ